MKKLSLYTLITVLSLCNLPTTLLANEKNPTTEPKEIPAEVRIKLNRLDEIKAMDKSSLNSSEKKELRKEVRSIKADLRTTGGGLYLSVGAIIIIILLLILLL
jgi:hypothetical protein